MKKLLLAILTIVLGASFIYPPAIIRAKDDVLLAVNSKVKLWDFSLKNTKELSGPSISNQVSAPLVAASISLVNGSS